MKKYKLIGFDMDGTLCHPITAFDKVFEQAFGLKQDDVRDVWVAAVMAGGARTGIEAIKVMLPNLTQKQAQDCLLNFSDLWAREQKLFDGVIPMLKRLKASGVQLTLITNGPSVMQHAVIDHLDIRECFDRAFTTGDKALGINKPQIGCFDKVAGLMNVEANECLFIGDGELNDYKGAMSAGWDAMWVKPTNDEGAEAFEKLISVTNQSIPFMVKWV